jgi:ribose transport system ATP-binding protein
VTEGSGTVALGVRGVSKTFGATRALVEASFAVDAGTVHGLLGENGSGKSTLVKILSGYHAPDEGELEAWGEQIRLPVRLGGYRELGIAFVHQSLGLAPALSVTENLMVADVTRPGRIGIRWRRERAAARRVLEGYGVKVDVGAPVETLTRAQQAMLAIVRAAEEFRGRDGSWKPGLLVLDEPTASFALPEKRWLYETIRSLTANGGAVLLISHDIDEILEITDEVTVLRDGRVVATRKTPEVSGTELAELIVGRHLARGAESTPEARAARPERGENLARVEGLVGTAVHDVSFDVARGEVVGLTGLAGSGFEEVLQLVFGVEPAVGGTLAIKNRVHALDRMRPQRALELGLALVPGDRERAGGVLELSITDNTTICSLPGYRGMLGLSRPRMSAGATQAVATYGVRAAGVASAVGSLSGGNQQKVLIAKWMGTDPDLLLLQEPTVGLDVGARLDIFGLVRDVAAQGRGVVCASADWEQLAEICDRVLIVARGAIAAEVTGDELTETAIGHACYRANSRTPVAIDTTENLQPGGEQ